MDKNFRDIDIDDVVFFIENKKSVFEQITTIIWPFLHFNTELINSKRRCDCCHRSWEKTSEKITYFSYGDTEKAICDKCVKKILREKRNEIQL